MGDSYPERFVRRNILEIVVKWKREEPYKQRFQGIQYVIFPTDILVKSVHLCSPLLTLIIITAIALKCP